MSDRSDIPPEQDVLWRDLEESAAKESRPQVVENLRQIRAIARFNSLLISGQDPRESMGLGEDSPAVPLSDEDQSPPISTERWRSLHLRRLLGQGAHAEVYLAWDPRLDREIALKLYSKERLDEDDHETPGTGTLLGTADVVREGRLMARVSHPNVIAVHGAEESGGRVGIWMDFIRGKTLSAVIKEQGTLGGREAALIGLDLCQALAAVHARGMVHQDVKAQNVMRENGGRIVLMDFGVGMEIGRDDGDAATVVAGTPFYMSPEALLEGKTSKRSDVYSLGVLLFHLVTGRFPMQAEDMADLVEAHRQGRRTLLRDLRPDLDKSFIDVVDRALARDPSDRFATMGEMEQALDTSLGSGRPTAHATKSKRWIPWTPAAIILAAAAVIISAFSIWGPDGTKISENTTKESGTQSMVTPSVQENPGDAESAKAVEPIADEATTNDPVARDAVAPSGPMPNVEVVLTQGLPWDLTTTMFTFLVNVERVEGLPAPVGYAWDWDNDGNADLGFSPSREQNHRFSTPGHKVVTVFVKLEDGRVGQASTSVDLSAPSTAAFEFIPGQGTTGTVFEFDASRSFVTGAVQSTTMLYRWDWESDGEWDTQFLDTPRTTHHFPSTGSWRVTLQVRSQGLSGDTSSKVVVVFDAQTDNEVIHHFLLKLNEALVDEDLDTIQREIYRWIMPEDEVNLYESIFRGHNVEPTPYPGALINIDSIRGIAIVDLRVPCLSHDTRESHLFELRLEFIKGEKGWRLSRTSMQ